MLAWHVHLSLVLLMANCDALFLRRLIGPDPDLTATCAKSGICMMCTTCWLVGGQVGQSCGGLFFCCSKPPLRISDSMDRQRVPSLLDIITEKFRISALNIGINNGESDAQSRKFNVIYNDGLTDDDQKVQLSAIKYGPVANEPNCGLPLVARRRIVGGSNAGFGQNPWQAFISIGRSRCGGALIDRRHVVTAGHCVNSAGVNRIRVSLGEYTLFKDVEPLPKQEYGVVKVFQHPFYRFTPQADRYDVAVLRLDRSVQYAAHIVPICLPDSQSQSRLDMTGRQAYVSGWGATTPGSKTRPLNLQMVDVNIVDGKICEKWHYRRGIRMDIHSDMMCAGHRDGGKDACQGDSGGPLTTLDTFTTSIDETKPMSFVNNSVLNDSHSSAIGSQMNRLECSNLSVDSKLTIGQRRAYQRCVKSRKRRLAGEVQNRWVLIGLVSAGYSCAKPGQPGIYHRISQSAPWISYVTRLK